jgi:nuclear receptor-binding protein
LFHALSDNTLNENRVGNVAGGGNPQMVNCAADIYSFGMVALEMAAQWPEGTQSITPEIIEMAIEGLEDANQRDFIRKCIQGDNFLRPSVKELLLQPIMLEVYGLKIVAGHAFVDSYSLKKFEQMEERDPDRVMAVINPNNPNKATPFKFSMLQVQPLELEKFLEEIKTGLYPLTGMERTEAKKESRPQLNASRPKSPEDVANNSQGNEEEEKEVRLIIEMKCTVTASEDGSDKILSLHLRLNDNMNRQLTRTVPESETGIDLADELVKYGLVSELDREKVASKIDEYLLMPC